MRALVAGWFSFERSDFTAGDLLACDLVCEWLQEAGYDVDVARVAPLQGGVRLDAVDPARYSHVVFVCGPFMRNALEDWFLKRFAGCHVTGVNVSLPVPLDAWNPFDLLFERDSSARARPDLTFLSPAALVPVVGVCLVEPYAEAIVEAANAAVMRLLAGREAARVVIDTRLDVNSVGLRTPAEIESLIARMDAIVTTRLHGTVLALKHGVPAVVIDPEPGGGRIKRQADTVGWPVAFTVDALDDEALRRGLDYCLSAEARTLARECAARAAVEVEALSRSFVAAMREAGRPPDEPMSLQ